MPYYITPEDKAVMNEFKQKNKCVCAYCGKNISNREELTVDHKIPISRGGTTVESNLAISCYKCNGEKSDMTDEEYSVFKQKQRELCDSLELADVLDNLIASYNLIIERASFVNNDCIAAEKDIERLENELVNSKFNACEGYALAKKLKEALVRRNRLRNQKEAYNALHSLVGNNKKQLISTNERIIQNLLSNSYAELKQSCIKEISNNNDTKVISIQDVMAK